MRPNGRIHRQRALLVTDNHLAGNDWASSRKQAHHRADADRAQGCDINAELSEIGYAPWRQGLPEDEFQSLCKRHRPYRAVEIASLCTFAFGGRANSWQNTEQPQRQDSSINRKITVIVDLLHVPDARNSCPRESEKVERSKGDDVAPGKRVTDTAIERIGAVFRESKDVRGGFNPGKLATDSGNACTDQDEYKPAEIPAAEAVRKQVERQRARGQKKYPDPDRPMGDAVNFLVEGADLDSLAFVFNLHGKRHRLF